MGSNLPELDLGWCCSQMRIRAPYARSRAAGQLAIAPAQSKLSPSRNRPIRSRPCRISSLWLRSIASACKTSPNDALSYVGLSVRYPESSGRRHSCRDLQSSRHRLLDADRHHVRCHAVDSEQHRNFSGAGKRSRYVHVYLIQAWILRLSSRVSNRRVDASDLRRHVA